MQKKINISGILLIVVLIIFLFFPQLLLLQPFDHINFPLGTPITWIGMIALNSLMYYLHILRIKNPASLGSIIKAILKLFMRLSYC